MTRLAALRAHAATLDEFPCVGDPAEHIMEHEHDRCGGWCGSPRRWYAGSVLPELGISLERWLTFCVSLTSATPPPATPPTRC